MKETLAISYGDLGEPTHKAVIVQRNIFETKKYYKPKEKK